VGRARPGAISLEAIRAAETQAVNCALDQDQALAHRRKTVSEQKQFLLKGWCGHMPQETRQPGPPGLRASKSDEESHCNASYQELCSRRWLSHWSTRMNIFKKYGFGWVTLILFLASMIGQWSFGWYAYVHEAEAHNQPVVVNDYVNEMSRDTLENWQSEFLQLIWQVAGLSFLFYVGSSQSKEGDERVKAKIDFLLEQTKAGREKRAELDQQFLRQDE
jgi:hypothetical protein